MYVILKTYKMVHFFPTFYSGRGRRRGRMFVSDTRINSALIVLGMTYTSPSVR